MLDTLSLDEVAAETRHSTLSVRRWIKTGILCHGRRVRLAAKRIGGRLFVERESLDSFIATLSADVTPPEPLCNPTAEAKRNRAEHLACLAMLGLSEDGEPIGRQKKK